MNRQDVLQFHRLLLVVALVLAGITSARPTAAQASPSTDELEPPEEAAPTDTPEPPAGTIPDDGSGPSDEETPNQPSNKKPADGRTPGHFQLEAVSEFPVQIGVGFQGEFQSRIQFRTTIGMVPAAYLGIANDLLVGISDEYSRREAELIENVLERSLMWRAQVGFRPFKNLGLYIQTGYSMVTLAGSTTNTELLVDLNEGRLSEEEEEELRNNFADETLNARSTLHQWGVEIGYDWGVTPHFRIRTALGWAYTFTSSSQVEAQFSGDRARTKRIIQNFENVGEQYIDESMQSAVHPPWLTLGIAYRF